MSRQFLAPTCDIVARNKIKALEAKVESGGSGGSGLPTSGEPYQQLVTDGEGTAKWEEKPFYNTFSETPVVENAYCDFRWGNPANIEFESPLSFTPGKTYRADIVLTLNGVSATESHAFVAPDSVADVSDGRICEITIQGRSLEMNIWYFYLHSGSEEGSFNISIYEISGGLKQLDEAYIPDTIARTSDVILAPATAEVGQTLIVKAVDENGKPTEWDVGGSGSGGGIPAVIIKQVGYDEVVNGAEISTEDDPVFTSSMAFDEVKQIVTSGKPISAMILIVRDGWRPLIYNVNVVETNGAYNDDGGHDVIAIAFYCIDPFGDGSMVEMYLTAEGVYNYNPNGK